MPATLALYLEQRGKEGVCSYPGYPWIGNQSLLGLEAGRVLSLWPRQAIKVLGSSRSSRGRLSPPARVLTPPWAAKQNVFD